MNASSASWWSGLAPLRVALVVDTGESAGGCVPPLHAASNAAAYRAENVSSRFKNAQLRGSFFRFVEKDSGPAEASLLPFLDALRRSAHFKLTAAPIGSAYALESMPKFVGSPPAGYAQRATEFSAGVAAGRFGVAAELIEENPVAANVIPLHRAGGSRSFRCST